VPGRSETPETDMSESSGAGYRTCENLENFEKIFSIQGSRATIESKGSTGPKKKERIVLFILLKVELMN